MERIKLYTKYRCKHTGLNFYIIRSGRFNQSFLPVSLDVNPFNDKKKKEPVTLVDEFPDQYFDKTKHHSHLLDCPECQKNWHTVTKQLYWQDKQAELNSSNAAAV
jgi:hypothetical protein